MKSLVRASRSTTIARASLLVLALTMPAFAQVQNTDQQLCLNTMNKNGVKVAKAQGKVDARCIKLAGREKVADADFCFTDPDHTAKVGRAETKVLIGEDSACDALAPDFGFTGGDVVNIAAVDEEITLAQNVFAAAPNDVQDAIVHGLGADPDHIRCQSSIAKAYEKFAAKWLKEFNFCKKKGLKTGTKASAPALGTCVGADERGKVGKARTKLLNKFDRVCPGLDLESLFPGCATYPVEQENVEECVAAAVGCRVCRMINAMDGLGVVCDPIDDEAENGSCKPQCGDGMVEFPEQCDGDGLGTGGETVTCDLDCTFRVCGDRTVNGTAGEECDDGNVSDGDCCDSDCDFEIAGSPCDDQSICTTPDLCNGTGSCIGTPAPVKLPDVCEAAAENRSLLKLKLKTNNGGVSKNKLIWKWRGPTEITNYGPPTADPLPPDQPYTLCLYENLNDVPLDDTSILTRVRMPHEGTHWEDRTAGDRLKYKYKKRNLKPDGVKVALLQGGVGRPAKMKVVGKGSRLRLPQVPTPPALPVPPDILGFPYGLTVQMRSDDPAAFCKESNFTSDFGINSDVQFKDKSDEP